MFHVDIKTSSAHRQGYSDTDETKTSNRYLLAKQLNISTENLLVDEPLYPYKDQTIMKITSSHNLVFTNIQKHK